MILIKRIFFVFQLLICISLFQCKQPEFKKYSYNNIFTKINYSFDIPKTWVIEPDSDITVFIGVCKPTIKEEIDDYEKCFEWIIFRIQYFNSNLDSTLISTGMYQKKDGSYVTSDRVSNDVKTEKLSGRNWTGLYHLNACGIKCNDSGFHPDDGECEFIYFSDGRETICISTNGKRLDKEVLKQIEDSFSFNWRILFRNPHICPVFIDVYKIDEVIN